MVGMSDAFRERRTADPSAALGGCDFIDFSREVIEF